MRDSIPGMRRLDGSIETNNEEKAQIIANSFQTVYTRESSLHELGPPSNTRNSKQSHDAKKIQNYSFHYSVLRDWRKRSVTPI